MDSFNPTTKTQAALTASLQAATAATATAMTAAPMNPRENASTAPLALVNAPALLATMLTKDTRRRTAAAWARAAWARVAWAE